MIHKPVDAYVRCFWVGKIQLTNGDFIPIHCSHISNKMVEIETVQSLPPNTKVKLELKASHKNESRHIVTLCQTGLDILNEHDKHYIKLHYTRISAEDKTFIESYVEDHA